MLNEKIREWKKIVTYKKSTGAKMQLYHDAQTSVFIHNISIALNLKLCSFEIPVNIYIRYLFIHYHFNSVFLSQTDNKDTIFL